MSNTLNGINLAQIAQETLRALTLEFLPLNAFLTDFSDDIKDEGESVTTRFPSTVAAVDLTGGYTVSNVVTTSRMITLDKFKGFVYAFTDVEVSKAGDANWLRNIFLPVAIEATLKAPMDDVLALVTAAAFVNATVVTAANFDADHLADEATNLSTAKVMKGGRFALLKPTYHGSLVKDNAIQNAQAFGDRGAVVNNVVPRVHGFDIYEYNAIPSNGEALECIVGNRQGLILAARQAATPANFYGQIENIKDPVTGFPIQMRAWYDHNNGKTMFSMGAIYGVQIGVVANIRRLTSA